MSDSGDRFFSKLCEAKSRIDTREGGNRIGYDRVVSAMDALRMAREAFVAVAGIPTSPFAISTWVHRARSMLALHGVAVQVSRVYRIAETDLAEAAREYELAREAFLTLDRVEAAKRATVAALKRVEADMKRVSIHHSFPSDPEVLP